MAKKEFWWRQGFSTKTKYVFDRSHLFYSVWPTKANRHTNYFVSLNRGTSLCRVVSVLRTIFSRILRLAISCAITLCHRGHSKTLTTSAWHHIQHSSNRQKTIEKYATQYKHNSSRTPKMDPSRGVAPATSNHAPSFSSARNRAGKE